MGGLAAARARSEQIHLIANRLRLGVVKTDDDLRQALRRFVHEMAHLGMTLVDASRFALPETLSDRPRDIDWLLARGRLKEAFYRADHHPDGVVRKRYKQLQELLQGPPLNRPPFAIIVDPETGRIDLRERVPDSPSEVAEVPLDLAGLGVVQVYGIIGSILLQPARAVGIEEPEAHLHAPTTGKDLRVLLERMVNEGYIDQLFIATHSNLFDLDPTGYFDVSREEGKGTIVVREKDLTKIDKDHLYEPGPAKHALQRSLEYLDDDEVVFRRNDTDEPVTAKQMIEMLQRDDELAFEFLDDVHEAAVRAVRVKSKRGTPAK